jgi:phosphoglycerate dehydrogenase-like enzyme
MKLVIYPAVEPKRLQAVQLAAPGAEFANASNADAAEAAMPEADGFLGKITPAMLAAADRLRWVQSFTASLEHYMFPALQAHPCVLTNLRGLFGDVIADQVMGYVLCFARNLHTYIRRQVERRYEPIGGESARVSNQTGPGTVNAMDRATIYLPLATLGIVGLGGIGCEVARRAMAFGMAVRGVDRFPDRVQAPEVLSQLRPSSFLINIGRGAIVVLDDLVAALRAGKLAGAALDVYEIEPLPKEHPLWDFPNVILTPHTAGYSPVIAGRHLASLVENVGRFARGEPLLNVVDKSLWF